MNTIRPAIFYGICTKQDHGYNFYGFVGAEVFRKEYDIKFDEYSFMQDESHNIFFLRWAAKKGNNPIVCLASEYKTSVQSVAEEFPNTHFVILNDIVKLPNVQSIIFSSSEGTFLVGMAAGMVTKSNIIGVSLLDINCMLRDDVYGFLRGVKYTNPEATVIETLISRDLHDVCNVEAGYASAKEQIVSGADILFAPIHVASRGALLAAKEAGKLYVGSNMNQNYLYPSGILTSYVFYLNRVVYNILLDSVLGKWKSGVKSISLKDGVFDWALDRFNCDLISNDMAARINQAKVDIVGGAITLGGSSCHP